MTSNDSIVNKIQNLLNKTVENGATEAEAQSALLLAQKLMAKYNVDLEKQIGSKEYNYSLEQTKVKANPRNNQLGLIIADSFAVKGILISNKWTFFGRQDNAKAAASAMSFVVKVMEAGMRRVCREHGLETSERGAAYYYNPYALGFTKGLKEAMDAQCKALAVVVPEDVKDKFAEKFPETRQYRSKGMKKCFQDLDAYFKGHQDGRQAMDKRSLQQG